MGGHMSESHEVSDKERQHKYEVEDAMRTLTKAEEIKVDKKLYAEACEMMKEHKKNMEKAMEHEKS